jgi:hypothetical protein
MRIYTKRDWRETFFRRAVIVEGCWLWDGAHTTNGYGELFTGKRTLYAHRASYEIHFGPIPEGMHVCHKCDNPGCCNPTHLFLGTPADNANDKARKGRTNAPRGNGNGRSKIRDEDLPALLRLRAAGLSQRLIGEVFGVKKQTVAYRLRTVSLPSSDEGTWG